ncbi:MAG: metallophosphoesterase, partial [Bacteroidales bacterium]|nr:metallophosphoesterase [Bacteroidales bacterium]
MASSKSRKSSYSMIILGDTHCDTDPDSVYHTGYSDPNPTREANHRKEFVRNSEMWAERMPKLLKRAACLADDDTKAVLHMGDLIQGDCGDVATHTRMLSDCVGVMKDAFGPLPFVTVAGNHDLRGRDDRDATQSYTEYMPAKMSEELGKKIEKTTFSFTVGKDVYIVIDFTHPDDEEIEKLLEESKKARYTFIIVHGPVFPYDSEGSYNWIFH